MIAAALFRHLVWRQGAFLAVSALLLALFQLLICAAVSSANLGDALETLFRSLPPGLQNLKATQFVGGFSERGLVAFGWNHPVTHALGTAAAIVLASRAVAGEIESGAVELLLSQPFSRATYFFTHVLFALVALGILALSGIAGTSLGQVVFHRPLFGGGPLLRVGLAYFLLLCAWFGLTLAFSSVGQEGGRVAGFGFLLALGSFLAQGIGLLWSDAAFILPWTVHHYFSPQILLLGDESQLRSRLTLLALAAAGMTVAAWRFRRRDLP